MNWACGGVSADSGRITAGLADGFWPAPSTFRFFANGTCDGDGSAVANVGGDGGAAARDRSAASDSLAAGHYSYKAFVADNANYLGSDSGCEPFTIGRAPCRESAKVQDAAESVNANLAHLGFGTVAHDKAK